MKIIDLRIYIGFDRENRSGYNFTPSPQSLFTVKSRTDFQICYPHRIKIGNTKVIKICSSTKIRALNVNLGSEISYDAS